MVGRTGWTRSVVGLVGGVAVLVTSASAQQPEGQPPAPPTIPAAQPAAGPMPDGPPMPGVPGSTLPPGGGPGSPMSPNFPVQAVQLQGFPAPQRFPLKIDPKTPTKELLPTPPAVKAAGSVLTDDLSKVPEADFQAAPSAKVVADGKAAEAIAHQLARINHANAKKTDAFMAALLESRDDLAGLPFAMGDDCRSSGEKLKQFNRAVVLVRQALGGNALNFTNFVSPSAPPGFGGGPRPTPPNGGQQVVVTSAVNPQGGMPGGLPFWQQFPALCEQDDAARTRPDKAMVEHVTVARIAALSQMLAAESAELRLGLVKYLTATPHAEATRALARMAIYSPEDDVRGAAITALKVRREKDYTDVLLKGLRYPWPAVAKRAADAVARLDRPDLLAELVAVLDETDPRLPVAKDAGGKKVSVVREMVRVNHHRNCMMCHAPGNPETVGADVQTVPVPIPGQSLPLPFQGYGQSQSPDLMVRLDVTYLRQDFSATLPVADAQPWPEQQRFDFFVRERKLTAEEATEYREKLTPREAGVVSPYHRAALAALRDMTGKDTAPSADAWRKLLDLPSTTSAKAGG